jgi:catechol 2,3-dioxygenase-like lactoylglutathione lyase family enzyme
MDWTLEVVVLPVSDIDRSIAFYRDKVGFALDHDTVTPQMHVTQLTSPGSGCSIVFGDGPGMDAMEPGSMKGLQLVVADAQAAREELISRGADVSEIWHGRGPGTEGHVPGPDPDRSSYRTFASFADPDGNTWLLQEITTRLAGRVDAETTFASVPDLASALRRAEAAHGEHEKRTGERDENWPDWYAAYMVAERAGTELPT